MKRVTLLERTLLLSLALVPVGVSLSAGLGAQTSSAKATSSAAAGPRTVATTLQLMRGPIKSSSDAVFKAAGEPPTTADAWTATHLQALTLAETGNLLMIGSRQVDNGDWMKMARAMVDASATAAAAAEKQNEEALSAAGDAIYETCENCHAKYMKK